MKKFNLAAASAIVTVMVAGAAHADTIRFWTTENQPERLAKQEAMAADFNKITGHTVEVIPVEEKDLGSRATAVVRTSDSVGTATATTSIRLMGDNSRAPSGSLAATLTINGIDFVAVTSASAFEDAPGAAAYFTHGEAKATFGAI